MDHLTMIRCYKTNCTEKCNCGYCTKQVIYLTDEGCMDFMHVDDVEEVERIHKEFD